MRNNVKRATATGALVIAFITTTAAQCGNVSPCVVEGEKVHGGGPRANSQECKDMQERAKKAKANSTRK